ncbi:hypothetical protein [Mesorhizobium sp. SARCC-RB16n]|uniref:hypothetical protein n=1 Tax=Mesorhizobium sp. SARCC-RB16n TaxID=2116687 RepID=UPI00166416B2|nr:hypothetical protein [Mesorhizobium sp. SARCC-RB16n]
MKDVSLTAKLPVPFKNDKLLWIADPHVRATFDAYVAGDNYEPRALPNDWMRAIGALEFEIYIPHVV